MKLLNSPELLEKLDMLIRQQKTGSPKELAQTLGISRARLYMWMDEMANLDLHIAYSKHKKTFYYIDSTAIEKDN
ncbi:MAG: hypothetical protein PHH37_02380 [Paludibacter sp.]|nr:hypothetical protein [Paludibacter sp.]